MQLYIHMLRHTTRHWGASDIIPNKMFTRVSVMKCSSEIHSPIAWLLHAQNNT